MRRLLLFIPIVLFILLSWLFFSMMENDPRELNSALIDKPFPSFTLPDLDDASVYRSARELKGQTHLVNVWATWCPACRAEHEYLVALRDRGVPIVGLNYKDNREAARRWLDELGNPYQHNIFDAEGRLGLDLGVYGAPETYVVDEQGIVRLRHVGIVNDQVWRDKLAPWFEPAVPANQSSQEAGS